jgi:rare lipoprotein A (peptidoglycan hydrolase)
MISYIFSLLLSVLSLSFEQSYNKVGYVQKGVASYYADDFHGKKTANGEKFDMNTLTAAHPRIRFNTLLKVTNSENGKSVVVRVNDRGPYVGGRILDLSRAAAQKIDMIRSGTATISAEVISVEQLPTIEDIAKRKSKDGESETEKVAQIPTIEKAAEPKRKTKVGGLLARIKDALIGKVPDKTVKTKEKEPQNTNTPIKVSPKPEANEPKEDMPRPKPKAQEPKVVVKSTNEEVDFDMPRPKPAKKAEIEPKISTNNTTNTTSIDENKFLSMNTYNIWGTEKFPDGHGVQIGSYSDFAKAIEIAKDVQQTNIATVYLQVGVSGSKKVYRVIAGEGEVASAKNYIPLLKDKGYAGVFVKQHY